MRLRFSKQTLKQYVDWRLDHLQKTYKFDPNNGWAQVQGKGEEINRAYGEWFALELVYEQFSLGELPEGYRCAAIGY